MKYLFTLFVLGCLFLTACHSSKKTIMLSPVTVKPGKNLDIYRASRTRVWDIVHTRAKLGFSFEDRTADGEEWVLLHPYLYSTDSLELDAKGMQVSYVSLADVSGDRALKYGYANDVLHIKFAKLYAKEDTIMLHIKYKAMPYAQSTGGSRAISDDRGLYFINTDYRVPGKPLQIWTQGETEANSRWLPTIDAPNERFTVQLELTVPDSFTTLSNGYISGQMNAGNGRRTDVWRMDKPIQTYAIMFAIGNYAVVKDEWKRREISYYVEPEYEQYARLMFKNTPEMVDYFSTITGVPYPWNKYSQIVVRDYVSGAMENTSATLFGEFINQNAREHADKDYEDVVSHELFHQWFGDYVTAESWSNLTLNESFATYGEILWRKYKYGKASADELGFSSLWSYLSQAASSAPPLARYHYSDKEDMFDRVSYQKGAMILNYLHGIMGDTAFNTAMRLYLTQNALKPAEVTHWRLAVEEATGQDWNWFFDQWYYRGGHPELDVRYDYDDNAGRLTVTVTQKQEELFILPLKSEVIYNDEKTVVDWDIRDRKHVFTYPYKNTVKPVIVPDAAYWLVGQIGENKEPWQWLVQYKSGADNILNKHYAIGGVKKKLDNPTAQKIFELALADTEPTIRELVLDNLAQQNGRKIQDEWKSKVSYLLATEGNNKVRAAAFDVLAAWKINSNKDEVYAALQDSSYAVAGAALKVINAINKDTAYGIAKQLLVQNPKANLQLAIWDIIAKKAVAADAVLFVKNAPYFYGTQKLLFAYSTANYLGMVEDANAFEQVLMIYEMLIIQEGIKSYRMAMAASLLQVAADYKGELKKARSNAEKARIQHRLDTMKQSLERIIKTENEKDNLEKYKEVMKAIYD
jgi:aminopeptidase N